MIDTSKMIKGYLNSVDKYVLKYVQNYLGTEETNPRVLKEMLDNLGLVAYVSYQERQTFKENSTFTVTSIPTIEIITKEVFKCLSL